jgi:hypothetical protein
VLGELCSAHDVAAANDHPDLSAKLNDLLDLTGDPVEGVEVETESLAAGECLAGNLEKNPRIRRRGQFLYSSPIW